MRVDNTLSPQVQQITAGYSQGQAPVTADQSAVDESVRGISRDTVEKAVDRLNKTIEIFNHRFKFSVHEATRRIMVQVIDTETNEVINEIPPEKILDLVAALQEIAGILVDKRV